MESLTRYTEAALGLKFCQSADRRERQPLQRRRAIVVAALTGEINKLAPVTSCLRLHSKTSGTGTETAQTETADNAKYTYMFLQTTLNGTRAFTEELVCSALSHLNDEWMVQQRTAAADQVSRLALAEVVISQAINVVTHIQKTHKTQLTFSKTIPDGVAFFTQSVKPAPDYVERLAAELKQIDQQLAQVLANYNGVATTFRMLKKQELPKVIEAMQQQSVRKQVIPMPQQVVATIAVRNDKKPYNAVHIELVETTGLNNQNQNQNQNQRKGRVGKRRKVSNFSKKQVALAIRQGVLTHWDAGVQWGEMLPVLQQSVLSHLHSEWDAGVGAKKPQTKIKTNMIRI